MDIDDDQLAALHSLGSEGHTTSTCEVLSPGIPTSNSVIIAPNLSSTRPPESLPLSLFTFSDPLRLWDFTSVQAEVIVESSLPLHISVGTGHYEQS